MGTFMEITAITLVTLLLFGLRIWRLTYGYPCPSCIGGALKRMDRLIGKWAHLDGKPVPDSTEWWQCSICSQSSYRIRGKGWHQDKTQLLRSLQATTRNDADVT